MDYFKQYIHQYRDELDVDVPSSQVWERLEKELKPAKKAVVVPMFVKRAVAACVVLLAGIGAYILIFKSTQRDEIVQVQSPVKLNIEQQAKPQYKQNDVALAKRPSLKFEKGREDFKSPATKEKEVIVAKTKKTKAPAFEDPYSRQVSKAFSEMEASYASMVNIQLERIKGTPIYAEDENYFYVFKKQFQDLNNDEKVLKNETNKNGINDDIITRMIAIYQEKISLLKQLQFEINKMNNRVKNSNEEVPKQVPSFINL